MIGPILVFLSVCALVAIYMAIVHSFLRASETETGADQKIAEEHPTEEKREGPQPQSPPSRPPQWAH
jgi:hypothetical protein